LDLITLKDQCKIQWGANWV